MAIIRLTFFLVLIQMPHLVFTQGEKSMNTSLNKKASKVKLAGWEAKACDSTFDPDLLVNRITDIHSDGEITSITINFKDNCCVQFKPEVELKGNKLQLFSYKNYSGDYCMCNCCFSIEFRLTGLTEKNDAIYFNGERVVLSADHYAVKKVTSEYYEGKEINRTNRYGFKEGIWMTFYKDGKLKTVERYADQQLYDDHSTLWSKDYFPSGTLQESDRADTLQQWFEDGELAMEHLKYRIGDTTYEKGFKKYDDKKMFKRYFRKSYPVVFLSEFNPDYHKEGSIDKPVYDEEYFDNGQLKYRWGEDSVLWYFRSGKVELIDYKGGERKYDSSGRLIEQQYDWMSHGPSVWGDIEHSLLATFDNNGKVVKIFYWRDEVENGSGGKNRYVWSWDGKGILTEHPEKWEEELPWKKFKALKFL